MANRRSTDSPRPAAASRAKTAPRPRPPRVKPSAPIALTAAARRELVAVGAYLRAERRGFAPGHEAEDWLASEAEVDALLKVGPGSSQ